VGEVKKSLCGNEKKMRFPLSAKELYLYCTMNEREMNIGKIANSLKMSKLTNKNKAK
jgi:hypothetical protein